MGSLTKRPKIPKQVMPAPTIQYLPAPAPSESTPSSQEQATEEERRAEARKESLLRRTRGRLGTVFTGFRGLLNPNDGAEAQGRKSLLGE